MNCLLVFLLSIPLTFCTSPKRTVSPGPILGPRISGHVYQEGTASWYGKKFHNRRTSNGEIYNMYRLTAAHRTLPFHTFVLVKNMDNHRQVIVRINDRGPFIKGRIIDLSQKAAEKIGILDRGTCPVQLYLIKSPSEIQIIQPKSPLPPPNTISREQGIFVDQTLFTIQAGAFGSIENAVNAVEAINSIIIDYRFKIERVDGYYKIILRTPVPLNIAERVLEILKRNDIKAFKKKISN